MISSILDYFFPSRIIKRELVAIEVLAWKVTTFEELDAIVPRFKVVAAMVREKYPDLDLCLTSVRDTLTLMVHKVHFDCLVKRALEYNADVRAVLAKKL